MLSRGWRRFGCEFFRPRLRGVRRMPQSYVSNCEILNRRVVSAGRSKLMPTSKSSCNARRRRRDMFGSTTPIIETWPRANSGRIAPIMCRAITSNFVLGEWDFARELQYYDDGRLVGVALADVTPNALTSIYFYHDPAWRPRSPGVFSILQQVAYARQLGLDASIPGLLGGGQPLHGLQGAVPTARNSGALSRGSRVARLARFGWRRIAPDNAC